MHEFVVFDSEPEISAAAREIVVPVATGETFERVLALAGWQVRALFVMAPLRAAGVVFGMLYMAYWPIMRMVYWLKLN